MSEGFVSEGFKPFPNTASDAQEVLKVVEWSDEKLAYKMNEYGEFLQRTDIMPRARKLGNFILDRLIFDMAVRDGVYGEYTQAELEGDSDGRTAVYTTQSSGY